MRAARATARYSRSNSYLLIVSLGAGAGCAGMEATAQMPLITLGIEEPARWIEPADLRRYQCELGSLVCTSAVGRLTTRLCRCVLGKDDVANAIPHGEVGR